MEKCQEGVMEDLIKTQTHGHSVSCKYKEGKRECRFGYPLPPLPETIILEPLPKDTLRATRKHLKTMYKSIQEDLAARTKNKDTQIAFTEYLKALDLSMEDHTMGKFIKKKS